MAKDSKEPIIENLPELPESWKWAQMNDIGAPEKNAIVDGPFGSNLKVSDYVENGPVPVLTTKNLTGDYSDIRYITHQKFEELKRSEVRPNDILMAKIGSCGKTGIYPMNMPSAIIPANLMKITVHPEVEQKFVYYYFDCLQFQNHLKKITKATAQPAFGVTNFKRLPFPLAPKEKQKRIVAKIEELFSHIDAGIEALKKAKQLLNQYRQSVLKAAVTGELTKEWRKENKDKLEPASQLLERILKERRQKWEEQQLRQFTAKGLPAPKKGVWWLYVLFCDDSSFYIGVTEDLPRRWSEHDSGSGAQHTKKHKPISIIHHEEFKSQKEAYNREQELKTGFGRKWLKREYVKGTLRQAGKMPKDDKWKEKYKEPKLPNINEKLKIPDTWCWVSGDQSASKIVDGTHHTPKYTESGVPFISVKDIRDDTIHFDDTKFISKETHKKLIQRCHPEKNDLLITKSGTIGRTAIIDTDREFSLFVSVALVKRITDNITPMFFRLMYDFYIQSIDVQQAVKGGMIKNLHLEDMRVIGLPLAPTIEQNVIVEEFEKKVESIRRLEKEIDLQLLKAKRNKQSVLASAFTGKFN